MWIVDRANRAAKPRVWVTIGVILVGFALVAFVSWAYDTMQESSGASYPASSYSEETYTTEDTWRDRINALDYHPDTAPLTDDDIAAWGESVCDDLETYQSTTAVTAVLFQSVPPGGVEDYEALQNNVAITVGLYCPEYTGW